MALTPEQVTGLRDAMGQVTADMTEYLLRDAARRIAEAGKMTSSAAYELYRSQALGAGQRDLKKELKRLLGLSWQKIWQLFEDAAVFSHQNDTGLVGVWASDAQSEILERMTSAAVRLAEKDFTNLTQTLGMVAPDGKAYPLRTFYRKTMDFAFEQVFTGAADYQTAIRQATAKMAGQGVVTIDYESGVHTSLEAAVRRSMMGGMGLLDEQITKADHDEFGCNGWEISAHAASAPDHEPYQGRQYSDAQYEALNAGLARRIGTLNCGHVAFPILLGVNEPQYSEAELEELRQDNARGITYEGRHYTKYEATQKQRQLERAQRLQKRRYLAADAAGDTEAARTAAVRLQALRGQYARFSKAAGLRTQAERIEVSGFGRKQAAGAVQAAKKEPSGGLRGLNPENKRVTIESISNVKRFHCNALDAEGQLSLQNAHKRLLFEAVKRPLGTEVGRCYSLSMQPLCGYLVGDGESSVKLPRHDVPYIAIHNHPSGLTLSPGDIRSFAASPNMRILTAIGNNGTVYAVEKTVNFRAADALIRINEINRQIKRARNAQEGLAIMQDFLQEAEEYGFIYHT